MSESPSKPTAEVRARLGAVARPLAAQALWLLSVALLTSWAVHRLLSIQAGAEMPSFSAWLGGALSGQLGRSTKLQIGAPVSELLSAAAAESSIVVAWAMLFVSLGAGGLAALWVSGRWPKLTRLSRGLSYLISAAPAFLLGYWLLFGVNRAVFAGIQSGAWSRPRWFPLPLAVGPLRYLLAALALAVGSGVLMEAARALYAELERMMRSEFVLFARAGGEPLAGHLLPNLVGPVGTLFVSRLIAVFGGAVVVEVIFNVPGLGRLTWDAAQARDPALLLGASALWALLYALVRWASAALSLLFDPKLRGRAR